MRDEFDTSEIAWDIYRLLYNIDFELEKDAKSRPFFSFCFNGVDLNMSGDTDFNFGAGWAHSISSKYENYLGEISEEYELLYKTQLEKCQILYKSILNISAMPQTGNLQGTKKGIGNDRLDTFIWALNCYFNKENSLLFNHSTFQNTSELKKYFDLFITNDKDPIYVYCGKIYGINEQLVDELIESGKEAIDSPDRVIAYMNLAYRFWSQKYSRIVLAMDTRNDIHIHDSDELEKEIKKVEKVLNSWFDT